MKRLLCAVIYFSVVGFAICLIAKATKPVETDFSFKLNAEPFIYEEDRLLIEEPEEIEYESGSPEKTGISLEEKVMLAKMTMAEAEGECLEGKCLVVRVILNRVESELFPGTVEEVISQKSQFTSYRNGRYENADPSYEVWQAVVMVCNEGWDESQDALFFERTSSNDTWQSNNRAYLFTVGNHTFYK